MNKEQFNNKLLASYAVFKEFTTKGKHIHDILSDFLVESIRDNKLYSFSASEVNTILRETYEFQIPDAVIKTLLKKLNFLEYNNQIFTLKNNVNLLKNTDLYREEKVLEEKNNFIIEKLYKYISSELDKELSSDEKNRILQSFTDFILEKYNDNSYSDYISSFIIKYKNDNDFINTLQTIKDGVILYAGIKYNSNFDLYSKWDTKLTIYLNTEVLFHAAGYNGKVFNQAFLDFYKLVKDINKKNKLIYLKYFEETENEITSFFYKAEQIVNNQNSLNPSNIAMSSIVNGCKDSTDVITKKIKFFNLIQSFGILKEEHIEYNEETYEHNIISSDIYEKEQSKEQNDNFETYLKLLNNISIKRASSKVPLFVKTGTVN